MIKWKEQYKIKSVEGEEWKDIPEFEGYQASNLGRIRSLLMFKYHNHKDLEQSVLKPRNNFGYLTVRLKTKDGNRNYFSVHRLVAKAFINNPVNKPQINHIDGVKHNNKIENLEWCTASENVKHAFDNGLKTTKKGIESHHSKLTEQSVLEIYYSKESNKTLSKKYNVQENAIFKIKHGRTWVHITQQEKIPPLKYKYIRSKLTDEQVIEIFNSPLKQTEIAKLFKIRQGTVSKIKLGQTWSFLTGCYHKNNKSKYEGLR